MKVGICGMGNMGGHHASLLSKYPGIELAAAADPVPEKRKKAEDLYGVRTYSSALTMIRKEKPDAVFVCTPTYLHLKTALAAFEAGCHVFCEKPMALSTEECDAMAKAARKAGKVLMVGQVLRFWPEYVILKKAVESGEYGKLQSLIMTRVGKVSTGWKNWFLDEKRGGTQIFDRHIHDADAVTWLLGMPKSVQAIGLEESPAHGGIVHNFTRYDYGKKGPFVCAEGSADLPDNYPFTAAYRAIFEKATIEFNSLKTPKLSVYDGISITQPELPKELVAENSTLNLTATAPYLVEEHVFFECIREGKLPVTITPRDARESIRLVRAEAESVRTGKIIKL